MQPAGSEVRVFAPASVANLGPGFDVLGLALEAPGDEVTARLASDPGVRIAEIRGDGGALPLDAERNTAGIAALAVLRRAESGAGIELVLDKGMPMGSGLGSSAASAAAAAVATNLLLGSALDDHELVACCVEAEAAVSGRHADNVAAAVMGGLIMVRSMEPLEIVRLPMIPGLTIAVVTPEFELPTREARAALPREVALDLAVRNAANLAGMLHAFHSGDVELLRRSLDDVIVTPARAGLIPGCAEVIDAAGEAGALGSSISGAGPSVFALCESQRVAAKAAAAMRNRFEQAGLASTTAISTADNPGARAL